MLILLAAALAGTVLIANLLVDQLGTIPVGFGLAAPAAVLAVGLAFTLRDLLRELAGARWPGWVAGAILAGTVLSLVAGTGRFAIASAAAFAVSETLDSLVYERLRRRWVTAVAVSGAAALVVDSLVFLLVAFGNLDYLPGQILGKLYVLTATVVLVAPFRRPPAPDPA